MQRTCMTTPGACVSRVQELETIMQNVASTSQCSCIITILSGSPGYGKTTLASVCCHRFVSHGTMEFQFAIYLCGVTACVYDQKNHCDDIVCSRLHHLLSMQLSMWTICKAQAKQCMCWCLIVLDIMLIVSLCLVKD